MTTPTVAVTLTAEIRLLPSQRIEVRYRLRNDSREDICIFNKMYRTKPSGERTLDDAMSYALLEDDDLLHLTRSLVPIPPGLKVEYPEVPYVTVLGAGMTSEGKVELPVPVLETHPYIEAVTAEAGTARLCKQVCFSIGYLPKTPQLALRALPDVEAGVYAVDYGPAVAAQRLVTGPKVKLEVAATAASPRPKWAK